MKKVVITGASGFIGRYTLEKLLNSGYEVHAIYNSNKLEGYSSDIVWHQVNLLEAKEVELLFAKIKPSHLLHLAWDISPGFRDSSSNFEWVAASLQILKSFKTYGGKRVVCAGTCFQYEFTEGVYNETTTPKKPFYLYGFCKQKLHEMFEKYAEKEDLCAAWGYIFYPYGEGDSPNKLIPKAIKALKNNETFRASSGEQIRDYIYVKDAASAFVSLLDSDLTGSFNIGSGKGIAIKDILMLIFSLFNKERLLQLGAIQSYSNEPDAIVADLLSIKTKLTWSPRYSFEDAIKEILQDT